MNNGPQPRHHLQREGAVRLGREVQSTAFWRGFGSKALTALRRFGRCAASSRWDASLPSPPPPAATAKNGPDFIAKAEAICGRQH